MDQFAPWAEIVPNAPPHMTVDDLLRWPDADGYRYELVEGVLVRVPGSGVAAAEATVAISVGLHAFVRPRRLGVVTSAAGIFTFPNAETALLPNVGYYVAARRALIVDRTQPMPFAPDLAVEVVSAAQGRDDLAAKARTYLRGGTRLVWVVWPRSAHIDVWRAASARAGGPDTLLAPAATLHLGDALDGEDVVPGFMYPVTDVFADPLA